MDRLSSRASELADLGLVIEAFGPDAMMVRETPALLGQIDVAALLRDLADELPESGTAASLKERLDPVAVASVERSGDMRYNGGSVAHLHVHFVALETAPARTVKFRVSARGAE